MNPFLILFAVAACLIGVGYFMRGSVSLRARDEFATKDYKGDAYYGQTMDMMHHHHGGGGQ